MALPVSREELDRLVVENLAAAQAFAVRLTGNVHDAGDVGQQALVRVAASAKGGRAAFRGEASFRTWLFQIVVHTFRDHLAKVGRSRESIGEEVADRRGGPGDAAEVSEMGRIVAAA